MINMTAFFMRIFTLIIAFCSWCFEIKANANPVELSQVFLEKVKKSEDFSNEQTKLELLALPKLDAALTTENQKKAFWINIYNAYIIIKIRTEKSTFIKKRNHFFTNKWLNVAGIMLSFDDIEHGVLRKSKNKYSRGHFNKFFFQISHFEKKFRVQTLDYRIHFALNCGASSCPPVLYYSPENIDEQLNLAMESFIVNDSKFEEQINTLFVSKIFFWFIKDFGGKKAILRLHQKNFPIKENTRIKFKSYDWTPIY